MKGLIRRKRRGNGMCGVAEESGNFCFNLLFHRVGEFHSRCKKKPCIALSWKRLCGKQ